MIQSTSRIQQKFIHSLFLNSFQLKDQFVKEKIFEFYHGFDFKSHLFKILSL